MDWFEIANSEQALTPALLFYPERIESNIKEMIRVAGRADRLRPHVKTYKCPEIVKMQMKAGIDKFKCATLSEAVMLGECGAKDVLISYPLIGSAQTKYLEITRRFPKTQFSTLIDHPEQIAIWQQTSTAPISVFIDLDVGMHRTGILPDKAVDLIKSLDDQFHLMGLHVYDGHLHAVDLKERQMEVEQSFAPVLQVLEVLQSLGHEGLEVVCGGSISFPIHAAHPKRTLSPGTTLLWDQGYSQFKDLKFETAATLMTRLVSKPTDKLICLDLGHKGVASEMSEASVFFPQIADAKIITHSEEHLVLEVQNAHDWRIGDVLYGIPQHICPTVALHESAGIITNHQLTEHWTIQARNRIYTL